MKTKLVLRIVSAIILLCALGCVAAYWYVSGRYDGEPVRIQIPAGTDKESVRDILTSQLGPDYGSRVATIWSFLTKDQTRAKGSYLVNPGTKALTLARTLKYGRQTPVRFTFNNLRTVEALAARAGQIMDFDSLSFMEACDSLLPQKGFSRTEYQAAFIPDTYEFYWTDPAVKVVGKLLHEHDSFWDTDRKAKAEALGLTPQQIATVASIAEEESAKRDERGKIGRLYINRLQKGMPLQADPTVKFALGNFDLRRITSKHLAVESPYNTYKAPGLPPGPIRIAERATIDSILNSQPHNYLYMCAKSDFSGYHDFSTDYNRHRINAARYHRALEARSIK